MAPQSLIICIDNAESTRNGDLTPTRLIAQQETVNEIVRIQLRSGPENDVALLTTAGRTPALLEPLTREQVTLQKKLYSVQPGGNCQPTTSLRIAQMVLKHRKGLRHGQRVLLFIGSPLEEAKDMNRIRQLGQSLRKANIFLDIVLFGTLEEMSHASELLQPLVHTMGANCQLISVTDQQSLSSTVLEQLTWLVGVVREAGPVVLGSDGSEDPELMLAIQMSLQSMNQGNEPSRLEGESPVCASSALLDVPTGKAAPPAKGKGSGKSLQVKVTGKVAKTGGLVKKGVLLGKHKKLADSSRSLQSSKSTLKGSSGSSWTSLSPAMSKSSPKSNSHGMSPVEAAFLQRIVASRYFQQLKMFGKTGKGVKSGSPGASSTGSPKLHGKQRASQEKKRTKSEAKSSQTLGKSVSRMFGSGKAPRTKSKLLAKEKASPKLLVNTQKIKDLIDSKMNSLSESSISKIKEPSREAECEPANDSHKSVPQVSVPHLPFSAKQLAGNGPTEKELSSLSLNGSTKSVSSENVSKSGKSTDGKSVTSSGKTVANSSSKENITAKGPEKDKFLSRVTKSNK